MILPGKYYQEIQQPGLLRFQKLTGIPVSVEANRMILAIALQETDLRSRVQHTTTGNPGPARGWHQFEKIGVQGVMEHPRTWMHARALCEDTAVPFVIEDIHRCLEGHDYLDLGFARLLLWADPNPLPKTVETGWRCYIRQWKPGKPKKDKWLKCWNTANEVNFY